MVAPPPGKRPGQQEPPNDDDISMLFLHYDGPEILYRQMAELADVEVYVDDPHPGCCTACG